MSDMNTAETSACWLLSLDSTILVLNQFSKSIAAPGPPAESHVSKRSRTLVKS